MTPRPERRHCGFHFVSAVVNIPKYVCFDSPFRALLRWKWPLTKVHVLVAALVGLGLQLVTNSPRFHCLAQVLPATYVRPPAPDDCRTTGAQLSGYRCR